MPELYWSEPFSRHYVEELNADESFRKNARKFEATLVLRCLDSPDGFDIEHTYRIARGVVSLDRWAEPSPHTALRQKPFDPSSALARTTAPYDIWMKLDRGEMNVLGAIRSPDYAVEGPKLKIMRALPVLNAMSACGARMNKRYA